MVKNVCGGIKKVEKKKLIVANFNIVFLDRDREYPMLDYFETILMPAFLSNYIQKRGDDHFLFYNVGVKQVSEGDYALVGNIVKKTVLEIKSDFDENGNLVEKNEHHPAAPYSMFVVYLKNHRMILVENQKGSPTLANFRALTNFVLNKYIKSIADLTVQPQVTEAMVNIVGMPMRENMQNVLNRVSKIHTLTLRFYPLNGDGDIDYSDIFGTLSKEGRREVGSNTGSITFNSPKNVDGVLRMVEKAKATVQPIFIVTNKDNSRSRIREDEISEVRTLNMIGDCADNEDSIVQTGRNIESINFQSAENTRIYERNIGNIIKFQKDRLD